MRYLLPALLLVAPQLAGAIIMRHDVPDQAYRDLAKTIDVSVSFIRIRDGRVRINGEGTHIGDGWVLTAAHVAHHLRSGRLAEINGQRIRISEVYPHPGWKSGKLPNDIALVRLQDVPVSGAARLGAAEILPGTEVTFVGRGGHGTGDVGVVGFDAARRAANNVVSGMNGEWMQFIFNHGDEALPLEGISGPGDSGGPALVGAAGSWTVIGVSCWQNTRPANRIEGRYSVIENYARVSYHRAWIDSVIAETRP